MTNDKPFDYAAFWQRVSAYLLDSVFLAGFCLFMCGPIALVYCHVPRLLRVLGLPCLFLLVFPAIYFAAFESSKYQATPGKIALGIIVTDLKGERISFGQAVARTLARALSGWLTLNIGYVIAAFTKKKQGLHDLIAATIVLKKVRG
jgi:uncharacterized RDD family membrane protein YckC